VSKVEKFNEQNDLSIEVFRKTEFLLFEAVVGEDTDHGGLPRVVEDTSP